MEMSKAARGDKAGDASVLLVLFGLACFGIVAYALSGAWKSRDKDSP